MRYIIALFVMLGVFVSSCQEDSNILVPQEKTSENTTIANPNFFEMPAAKDRSLEKIIVSQWAYAGKLTIINFSYSYTAITGENIEVNAQLKVPADALSQDALITINFDEQFLVADVSLQFGPSGLVFNTPLLLDVHADGLNLQQYSDNNLNFVYYNEQTTSWEVMPTRQLWINSINGNLICQDASVPHFSRFGFTR